MSLRRTPAAKSHSRDEAQEFRVRILDSEFLLRHFLLVSHRTGRLFHRGQWWNTACPFPFSQFLSMLIWQPLLFIIWGSSVQCPSAFRRLQVTWERTSCSLVVCLFCLAAIMFFFVRLFNQFFQLNWFSHLDCLFLLWLWFYCAYI